MNLGDVALPIGFGVALTVTVTGVGWPSAAGNAASARAAHRVSMVKARLRSWFRAGSEDESDAPRGALWGAQKQRRAEAERDRHRSHTTEEPSAAEPQESRMHAPVHAPAS